VIYFNRTLLGWLSLEDPDCDEVIRVDSALQVFRFNGSSITPKLETLIPESGKLPSFRDLTASLPELSVRPIPKTTFFKNFMALTPSTINCLTNIANIEDRVKYCQQLIASYPNHLLAPFTHRALGFLLHRAFECTNEIEYLNRAISAGWDSLNTANSPLDHSQSLVVLIQSLLTCLSFLKREEDLNELIRLLPIAAENAGEGTVHLLYSCHWAILVHVSRHSSVSTVYDCAMSLMQACLISAPTLDIQHTDYYRTCCLNG